MYKINDDIKIDSAIITMPGLLIGFNDTIFPGIDGIREALGMDSIRFYIETWDVDYNGQWIAEVNRQAKKFPKIKVFMNSIKYEDIGMLEHWERIYKELDLKYSPELNVHEFNFKRLVAFIVYQRQYERIYKDIHRLWNLIELVGYKNIPIIRLKPNMILQDKEHIAANLMKAIKTDFINHYIQFNPHTFSSLKTPFDVFYTDHITSHSVGDIFNFSSVETLYSIFGTDTEEIVDKFIELTKKYVNKTPFDIKTEEDFSIYATNPEYYSIEGSVLLKDIIDQRSIPVNYGTGIETKDAIVKGTIASKNPWFAITKGKIGPVSGPELLREDFKEHLLIPVGPVKNTI